MDIHGSKMRMDVHMPIDVNAIPRSFGMIIHALYNVLKNDLEAISKHSRKQFYETI